jgi:hypothetical protein
MAMRAILTLDEHTALAESVKTEYNKQADGTFMLDVTTVGDFALENVKGLKSSLSKERNRAEEAEKSLKVFGDLDPATAVKAINDLKELEGSDDKHKAQLEQVKKTLEDKFQTDLTAKDDVITGQGSKINELMVDNVATTLLSQEGTKGNAVLLMPHIKKATNVKKTDAGDYIVEVLDDEGNPRISPASGSTALMSITELVDEMKENESYAGAFDGSGASGPGAKTRTPSGKQTAKLAELPATERLKAYRRSQGSKKR